jgi:hypothetical protein
MAQPSFIQKTLRMSPEVNKIFDDLDEWLDHCRFNLLPFNPSDLYRSQDYKNFVRDKRGYVKQPYRGKKPYEQRFSR